MEKKLCNALLVDAQVDEHFVLNQTTRRVLAGFKRRAGGLWVGGTIVLGDHDLTFHQNALNTQVHESDYSWQVSLASIRGVKPRFGVLTGIVDVRTDLGVKTFRCFGAKEFGARIAAKAAGCHDPHPRSGGGSYARR